jgi:hypothetical protein
MICRVWRGWTSPDNASGYQELLLGSILPGIRARGTPGYQGVRVDRRTIPGTTPEVEFVTTMFFDTLDAVIAFAGPEYVVAVVPPSARQLLSRFDAVSAHYEVVGIYRYDPDFPAGAA